MSRPIQPVGHLHAVEHAVRGVLGETLADHEVAGQLAGARSARAAAACASARRACSTSSSSHSESPTAWPWAQRNGKHIAPPMMTTSASSRKRSITAILSATLAPPTIATSGRVGVLEDRRERRHLAFQQPPRGARQQVRDALGARVRAVGGAEGVVDIDVGELGQRACELGVVVGLAGLEAHVLEHQHLAVAELLGERPHLLAHDAGASVTVASVSSRRRSTTGASDSSASRRPSGRPRWETSTSRAPRARSSSIVGSAAHDARVVGHLRRAVRGRPSAAR